MTKFATAKLQARLFLKAKSSHYSVNEIVLTTYFQVFYHPLETHVMDYIIAETASDTAWYVKPSNMSPLELTMHFGPLHLDTYTPTSMSLKYPSLKDYCSKLGTVCNHTVKAI